jgi:ribosomal protein L14
MSTKLHRRTGSYLSGPFNAGVLLRKEDIQLTYANRLKRPVYRECRNHSKILAIAPNIY